MCWGGGSSINFNKNIQPFVGGGVVRGIDWKDLYSDHILWAMKWEVGKCMTDTSENGEDHFGWKHFPDCFFPIRDNTKCECGLTTFATFFLDGLLLYHQQGHGQIRLWNELPKMLCREASHLLHWRCQSLPTNFTLVGLIRRVAWVPRKKVSQVL